MTLTAEHLKQIAPSIKSAPLSIYPALLNQYMPKYGIDTPQRVSAFIAQLLHESGEFKYVRELASGNAYEGRKDLGNIHKGDGPKFKGRGLIQITGRTNYLRCSMALFGDDRLVRNPDILTTPQYAVESACWFWKDKGLNDVADKPETWTVTRHVGTPQQKVYSKFQWITRLINGGQNGIEERERYYEAAQKIATN